jgi:3-phenylpropionate/cinnamic acid dioxygenase small subunit
MDFEAEWIERLAVTDVLYRYATGIDQRDWSLLRSCFTEDCQLDYGDIGRWYNANEMVEWMRRTHESLSHTLHRITNPVVEIRGGGATAHSYVHAVIVHPSEPDRPFHAYGLYVDELVKSDGAWRIARRRYVGAHAGQGAGAAPSGTL